MKFLLLFTFFSSILFAREVQNFVYFELQRKRITEKSFTENPNFVGAQLKYTWQELEHDKDQYRFQDIRRDLATLKKHGKKLFIQIQDVTFNIKMKHVPPYLLIQPEYNGGADYHYVGEGNNTVPAGWMARRWDPAVRSRFHKLLMELGREFDGKIEGINLPETAYGYGNKKELMPKGFTPEIYRDATLETLKVLKKAFPKSVTVQYANFMPGEWRPEEDKGYLKSVYEMATFLKVGVGGPDVLPFKKGQMNHTYHFVPSVAGHVPIAMAVQEGNYSYVNPKTLKPITIKEIYDFAKDYLKANYLFWCVEDPYYTRDVLPFFKDSKQIS